MKYYRSYKLYNDTIFLEEINYKINKTLIIN